MKNRNLYVLGIVMIFISVGCNREEPFDNTEGNETETEARVISFTASIPSVRVALGQEEDNSISLSWEERDSIHLVFVQGENKIISGTRIKNISEDKKSAQFDIEIPGEIEDGELVLHGIYGNVTIESANPTWLVLPPDAEAAGSIEQVQEREDVILYFSSNLDTSSPSATASFNHLGSLFSVSLKNTSSRILDNIGELRLTGPAGGKWAYNSGGENGIYDLENEQFLNTGDAANYLAFQAVENSLAPGDSMAFWGWYPPLPGVIWPELKMELYNTTGALMFESDNSKPGKSEPTAAGKSYYFLSERDEWGVSFIDEDGLVNTRDLVENFDYPLGNIVGNRGWIAFSAEGQEPVQVIEGGLAFEGYIFTDSDGKSIRLNPETSSAEDICVPLETINSGSGYLSFLLKTDKTAPADNNPRSAFISFGSATTGGGRTRGRLATVETSDDHYKFRIMWMNTVEVGHYVQYDDREFNYGETYLVVLKYNIDNHEASAYFFDSLPPKNEPVIPDLSLALTSVPGTQNEMPQIRAVQLWQNGGTVPQDKTIDGIVVAKSWRDLFKNFQ